MEMSIISYLNKLTFQEFQNIITYYNIDIAKEDAYIVYSIIKNNIYALVEEQYHPVLYHCIEKKTSISTCQKIKKMISENPFYFKLALNV